MTPHEMDEYEFKQAMADYDRALFWTRAIGALRACFVAGLGIGAMAWLLWGLAR